MRFAATEKALSVSLAVTGSNEEFRKLVFSYGMKIRDNFLLMSSKSFPNFSQHVIYPTGAMLDRMGTFTVAGGEMQTHGSMLGRWIEEANLRGERFDSSIWRPVRNRERRVMASLTVTRVLRLPSCISLVFHIENYFLLFCRQS